MDLKNHADAAFAIPNDFFPETSDHQRLCILAKQNLDYHCCGQGRLAGELMSIVSNYTLCDSADSIVSRVKELNPTYEAASAFVACLAANRGVLRDVQRDWPDDKRHGGVFADHSNWEVNLRRVLMAIEKRLEKSWAEKPALAQ